MAGSIRSLTTIGPSVAIVNERLASRQQLWRDCSGETWGEMKRRKDPAVGNMKEHGGTSTAIQSESIPLVGSGKLLRKCYSYLMSFPKGERTRLPPGLLGVCRISMMRLPHRRIEHSAKVAPRPTASHSLFKLGHVRFPCAQTRCFPAGGS